MKIKNVYVYGLEESIKASGYPMSTEIKTYDDVSEMLGHKDYERMRRLGKAQGGSGHDCALKGIVVQADVIAPQYWWIQFQRYHFADIVSSQSKMHSITKMDIKEQCNEFVKPEIVSALEELVESYKSEPTKENFERIVANTPMGMNLGARITTNYLQLKSMYKQRRHHKLSQWQTFCDFVEKLPYFKDFVLGESNPQPNPRWH
jgi:hypothetical protein